MAGRMKPDTKQMLSSTWAGKSPAQIARELGLETRSVSNRLSSLRSRGYDVPRYQGVSTDTEDDAAGSQTDRLVIDRAVKGEHPVEISVSMGMKLADVQTRLSRARKRGIDIPYGGRFFVAPVKLKQDDVIRLLPCAKARGMDVGAFAKHLIATAIDADLVDAILDDGVQSDG